MNFGFRIWFVCITQRKKVYTFTHKISIVLQYFVGEGNILFLLYVMHRNQIQNRKLHVLQIFFEMFQNLDFWSVKIDMACLVNPKTILFYSQRAKPPLQALPCLRWAVTLKILPWPLEVKLWPWSKVDWNTFLIIFDELVNVIFPISLALLVTKIADEGLTFSPGGQFWKWNSST